MSRMRVAIDASQENNLITCSFYSLPYSTENASSNNLPSSSSCTSFHPVAGLALAPLPAYNNLLPLQPPSSLPITAPNLSRT